MWQRGLTCYVKSIAHGQANQTKTNSLDNAANKAVKSIQMLNFIEKHLCALYGKIREFLLTDSFEKEKKRNLFKIV
jgi:hypothetical protein